MKLFRFVIAILFVLIGLVQCIEDLDARGKQDHEGDLTEHFAVELDQDDEALAKDVAELHGFEYGGRIGSLPRHFHLIRKSHHSQEDDKRGDIPYPKLNEHPNVKWHEQQREIKLEKRDPSLTYQDVLGSSENDKKSSHSDIKYYNDPMFPEQWYINNVGQVSGVPAGRDMGILKAWKMGYTGKGIVVTVMDDGLDHTDKDLKTNYDPEASEDLNDNDGDPQPRDAPDQFHGTKCSGEIAAEANNNFCGVGLAPDVKIGAVRMLDGKVTGITEGNAFGLKPDYVDIYSASWGPKDNGQTLAGPSSLGMKSLEHGVTHGRKGESNKSVREY